jgi:nitroreductase
MEFVEVIKARRSIRKFKQAPVPDEDIKMLLEAARLAPSGLNVQPWRFAIVKNKSMREKLSGATLATYAMEAPVIIICCADLAAFSSIQNRVSELQKAGAFAGTCFQGYSANDFLAGGTLNESSIKANLALQVAIAIEHLALQAVDRGLGTCWIASFDEKAVKKIVGINDRYSIVALLSVGFPLYQPPPRPRLPIDELLIPVSDNNSNSNTH